MYLVPVLVLIAIGCVIGAIFSGGAATIILVPAAVLAAGVAYATRRRASPRTERKERDLGRQSRSTGPQTPDELVAERQHRQ